MDDPNAERVIADAEAIVRQAQCEHPAPADNTAWADRPARRLWCPACKATWTTEDGDG